MKFPASMPLTATAQASGADTLSRVGSTSKIRGAKQGLKNVQAGTIIHFLPSIIEGFYFVFRARSKYLIFHLMFMFIQAAGSSQSATIRKNDLHCEGVGEVISKANARKIT